MFKFDNRDTRTTPMIFPSASIVDFEQFTELQQTSTKY